MYLGRPRHKPFPSHLGKFFGRDRFAGTKGTRGDEYGGSSTWEERGNDSTCVRVDPNGSVVLARVVGFAFACVVLQSVEFTTAFTQVEPGVFISMIDEPWFAVCRLEGSIFLFSHLSLVRPHPRQPLKILVLHSMIHTTYYPSQFRFPRSCSRSDCFRSPGLIYVFILRDLYIGHPKSFCSRNHWPQRFHQNQNSTTHEVPAYNFSIPGYIVSNKKQKENKS